MDITTLLKLSCVKHVGGLTSKKRLFQELAELGAAGYGLPASRVVDALLERESLGPTGVGQGVALPHARLPEVGQMIGLFVRLEKPMDFEAVDRQPVDLVFALLAPEDAGVAHLKALALVSRTMRDEGVCTKLRANTDPATLYAVLTAVPAAQPV